MGRVWETFPVGVGYWGGGSEVWEPTKMSHLSTGSPSQVPISSLVHFQSFPRVKGLYPSVYPSLRVSIDFMCYKTVIFLQMYRWYWVIVSFSSCILQRKQFYRENPPFYRPLENNMFLCYSRDCWWTGFLSVPLVHLLFGRWTFYSYHKSHGPLVPRPLREETKLLPRIQTRWSVKVVTHIPDEEKTGPMEVKILPRKTFK